MKSGIKARVGQLINFIVVFVLLFSMVACSSEPIEVLEVERYIIKVNDYSIDKEEVMIYVYQVSKEFEEIGGSQVWTFEDFSGGKSAVEVAKDAVVDNVVRIKVLNDKSNELNITLTEEEIDNVNKEALDYLNQMDDKFKEANNIELDAMIDVFKEFAIANKVRKQITDQFSPAEVAVTEKMYENEEFATLKNIPAKELLTSVSLEHILFITREKDQSGEYVTLTEHEKELKYSTALEVYDMAVNGSDFTALREQYSEETFPENSESNGIYEFSKALIPEEFNAGVYDLGPMEISEIVESELGYHIFKVIDIMEPSADEVSAFEENFVLYEEDLRSKAIRTLKDDAFNNLYEEWKKTASISINRESWEEISLSY